MTEVKMYKFPDIEQFRNAIFNVKYKAQYTGRDENDQPMHDETLPLPILNYRGTVKLHGTNAAIVFTPDENGGYNTHAQSRENIITPQKDNAGFATFVHTTTVFELLQLINIFDKGYNDEERPVIRVYGEWCGKGIQAKVGITKLDKMFVIFAVKVGDVWLAEEELKLVKLPERKIYNICDYPSFRITIDFNNPKEAADKMAELVTNVEKECPVAKAFGVEGIGEGIVWTCVDKGWTESRFWFKTKGLEHSLKTSNKEKVPVDIEKINSVNEFINEYVSENRLLQGLDKLRESNLELEIKNIGFFLKWVYNDIIKEELDTIVSNGLEPKDLGSPISNKARVWFMDKLNQKAGIQ